MPPPVPTVVAHRGLHSPGVPENSVAAFRNAWAAGVAWVECDVWFLDVGPVVLHDDTLDRTTDGTGPVSGPSSSRVTSRRLRDASGAVTPHLVPRLLDVAAAMSPEDALLVEIKGVSGRDLRPDEMRPLRGRTVTVQSFDPRHLLLVRRRDRRVPLAWLVESADGLVAAAASDWPAVHARHDLLDEESVRRLRRAGKRVGAWTVNDPAYVRRVAALGVDTIITDDPLGVRRLLAAG